MFTGWAVGSCTLSTAAGPLTCLASRLEPQGLLWAVSRPVVSAWPPQAVAPCSQGSTSLLFSTRLWAGNSPSVQALRHSGERTGNSRAEAEPFPCLQCPRFHTGHDVGCTRVVLWRRDCGPWGASGHGGKSPFPPSSMAGGCCGGPGERVHGTAEPQFPLPQGVNDCYLRVEWG